MTKEEARFEINLRIDRETQFVLKYADKSPVGAEFLKAQLIENDKTLRLLGEFLAQGGDDWEKFYKEKYWDKRTI